MKHVIDLELAIDVIVRHEKDHVLLYHGKNGATIKVSYDIYHQIEEKCIPYNTNNKSIYDILDSQYMLKNSKQTILKEKRKDGKTILKNVSNFYKLKSRIAPLQLIWGITPVCNLNCVYCFPNAKHAVNKIKNLPFDDLMNIASQIVEAKVCIVTLSGGEAFLYDKIWEIILKLQEGKGTIGIITNGTSIDNHIIKKLNSGLFDSLLIGVSLDAPNEDINSKTRGVGAFKKTIDGITRLKNNVKNTINPIVTITKYNFDFIEEHFALLDSLKFSTIMLQDLRPFGRKEDYDRVRLSPQQEEEVPTKIEKLQNLYPHIFINTSEVLFYDKVKSNGTIMECPAGDNFGYIDFYGDMYPCTSFPEHKVGNLLKDGDIKYLWQHSAVLNFIRELKSKPTSVLPYCANCEKNNKCQGGCRGDALFYSNDLYGVSSRCPEYLRNIRCSTP